MLTIRSEQLALFARESEAKLIAALKDHVVRVFAEECTAIGEARLQAHIQTALHHARALGIRSEQGVFRYMNLSMLYGPRLGERPGHQWMNAYLADPNVVDPDERIHRVYQRVLAELRTDEANRQAYEEFDRER